MDDVKEPCKPYVKQLLSEPEGEIVWNEEERKRKL